MTKPTRPPVTDTPADTGFVAGGRPEDPRILLYVSRDNGATFTAQADRPLGPVGVYAQRVRWNRCGSGFGIVLRFVVSDAVPFAALDLQVQTR